MSIPRIVVSFLPATYNRENLWQRELA